MSSLNSVFFLKHTGASSACATCGHTEEVYGSEIHIYRDLLDGEPRPVYIEIIGPEGDVTIRLSREEWEAMLAELAIGGE